jgi:predicted secreted Zn-dependent protease
MTARCRLLTLIPIMIFYSTPLRAVEVPETQLAKPAVSCELKVKEKYEYYDVDGARVCDLEKQINTNGTRWNDGRTYAAVTSWDVNYSYDVADDKDGKCSVKSVKTKVDIVYHLPRRNCPTSTPQMTLIWDNYMVNLKHHEFGHKDLTVKVAEELNETLASLQGFSSHEELDREAKRRTGEKLRKLNEIQIAYDKETKHGETQGAVLSDAPGALVASHVAE